MVQRVPTSREGFTLIELLISLVLSVVVMGASLSFAMAAFRGSEGNTLREEVYRNARFIGMALERDVQTTGVGIVSELRFGTLSTFNDTLVILHVPWEPTDAFPYTIDPPAGVNNPLDPGGTCGTNCIDLNKDPNGNFDLKPGDIARLQVNAERRVILVTAVSDQGSTVALTFSGAPTLLHLESALSQQVEMARIRHDVPDRANLVGGQGSDLLRPTGRSQADLGHLFLSEHVKGASRDPRAPCRETLSEL